MNFKNFLWFLAGAEIFILKDCPKAQNKFLRTGLIIFLIGIVSGLSAGYAVYGSFDGNIYASILVGIIWASIIMTLDSLIVTTISDKGTFKEKAPKAALRIILSIFIGIVIARPAEIKIFEKEIKDKLIDVELAKCISRSDVEMGKTLNLIVELKEEKDELEKQNEEISKTLNCVEELITYESNGIIKELECGSSSGRGGLGERFDNLNARKTRLENELKPISTRISQLTKLIDDNNQKVTSSNNSCNKSVITAEISNRPLSLLEANTALKTLMFDSKGKGIGVMIIFITVLIVLIELLPILNKILFEKPSKEYEDKLAEYIKDVENMNYLDLLLKYPHLPARKQYLDNFQKNKEIHQKLLEEYMAISMLNTEAENKMEIVKNKQKIERFNEQKVNKQVMEQIKDSQIRIVKKIVDLWEEKTIEDIVQNPEKYIEIPKQEEVEQEEDVVDSLNEDESNNKLDDENLGNIQNEDNEEEK